MPQTDSRAWVGGRVYTGRRYAEALLVESGKVVLAGTNADVRRAMSVGTEVVDLAGRLLLPGLIDPHLHWQLSVVDANGVDARGTRSLADLYQQVAGIRDQHPTGPVVGGGWDETRLKEHRYPALAELDAVEGERPVALARICHHVAVVNSAALALFGIDASTPDPPGGRIGREASGAPNGVLYDTALEPVRRLQLAAFDSHHAEAIRFLHSLVTRGVTTVGAMSAMARELEFARTLRLGRDLPLRLRFYPLADQGGAWRDAAGRAGTSGVRVAGVKLLLDGSLGARTAWLASPYADRPSETGISLLSSDELRATIEEVDDHHLPVAIHAIGDRAVRQAVDVLRSVQPMCRPRLEHASVVPPDLIADLVASRALVVVQPRFLESDEWIGDRLGPARLPWAYPFRRLLDAGIVLAGSSDAPVEPVDPWTGLQTAMDRGGLSPEESVTMYTAAAGEVLGESPLGTLEPNAPADLVVVGAPSIEGAIRLGGPVEAVYRGGHPVAGTGRWKGAI